MCGIAGILNLDGRPVSPELVQRMTRVLAHRGPDDEGTLIDGPLGLGHRRLSVIDLSTAAHQPMSNEDETIWITYNGEIYNFLELKERLEAKGHRFRSRSDTEVILHSYEEDGPECVRAFNGMFAFALWDANKRTLVLARDRFGKKPLFYALVNNHLYFASEIKALLECPEIERQINPRSLHHFLSLNYVPGPDSIVQGVSVLPPAHILLCHGEEIKTQPYWDIYYDETPQDESSARDKLHALLHEAVGRRLISDVPLGAFLSGGIDSSAVVALMVGQKEDPIKTFTVTFQEPTYNESTPARNVSRHLGTTHYEIPCTPQDCERLLPRIVWHADNLLADPCCLPLYMVSKLAREHVTVVLSGDGGDELLAGYSTYKADILARYYRWVPQPITRLAAMMASRLPASSGKLSFDYRAKKFLSGAQLPADQAHYWWRTIFTEEEKRALYTPEFAALMDGVDSAQAYVQHYNNAPGRKVTALSRGLYSDIKVWLVDSILTKVDTMSMAHSLEARAPFLDPNVAEFLSSVPDSLKLRGIRGKYLLRQALAPHLPPATVWRAKAGFNVPLAHWFRGPLSVMLRDWLSEDRIQRTGIFRPEYVRRLMESHLNGQADNSLKLWSLLVLSIWQDTFAISCVGP